MKIQNPVCQILLILIMLLPFNQLLYAEDFRLFTAQFQLERETKIVDIYIIEYCDMAVLNRADDGGQKKNKEHKTVKKVGDGTVKAAKKVHEGGKKMKVKENKKGKKKNGDN